MATRESISALIKGSADRLGISFNEAGLLGIAGARETSPLDITIIESALQFAADAIGLAIFDTLYSLSGPVAWGPRMTFTHADFSIAALQNTLTLFAQPGRGICHGVLVVPTVLFSGGSASWAQISTGAAAVDSLSPAFNVGPDMTLSDTYFQPPQPLMDMQAIAGAVNYTVTLKSDVNLNLLTSGAVEISLLLSRS